MEAYKNVNLSIEERVDDLISRMTLPQKVAQLQCLLLMRGLDDLKNIPNGIGELTGVAGASAEANVEFSNAVQEAVISGNELGIPVIIHSEALSGVCTAEATIFPSAIGFGATWNPETLEGASDIIRKQMLAIGVRQALSPVMDVARDPRWGRIGETYGEDPTLCAAMSVAFTKGLQGNSLKEGVIATAKHFLGYGKSEGGLNQTSNQIPPRELREVYAKPFQAAITLGGLQSIMNSYGTIDGDMVIKSKQIMTDLLRDEMGFEGILVSDYMSINRAVNLKVSKNPKTAGIEALEAGLDVECPIPYGYTETLIDAVNEGDLDIAVIDRSARRVLESKFKLGLFDAPYARKEIVSEAYDKETSFVQSLKAARESIVLLKNDGILPLKKDTKKIAVIGPHADSLRLLFGGYTYASMIEMMFGGTMADMAGLISDDNVEQMVSGTSEGEKQPCFEGSKVSQEAPMVTEMLKMAFEETTPTILQSIKDKCPAAQVVYEHGCDIAGTGRNGFDAAIAAAKEADVVILTLGGKYGWGNNSTIGECVDCDNIGLPGIQEEFAKLIYEAGTPTVLVHMDARPLSSEYIAENYPAIIENWFPGITGGAAVADVLFGDYNPAGRLPATVVRNAGQISVYASYRNGDSYAPNMDLFHKYVDGTKHPLFYFGEGKSYTQFTYSNLKVSKKVAAGGVVRVSCDVTNAGNRDGEEVVQVYVSDEVASMLRPNKELAGFKRVAIKAGETKTVTFTMKADQFAFLDVNMRWIVEAGTMTVRVGASSEDIRLTDTFEIENTAHITGRTRGFFAEAKVE